jgi:NADH:ubiquinone oxidoreductase subunit E
MTEITKEMWKAVDGIIERHKGKRGALIPALEECQKVCGYLPLDVQRRISHGLNIPGSEVYGVVTFYSFFTMVPKGRHAIKVCLGTACYVRGGKAILDHLEDQLGLDGIGITKDRKFSVDSVRCIGACGMAPAMVIDDDTYAQVSSKNVMEILERYE